jgi:hypothetical protein
MRREPGVARVVVADIDSDGDTEIVIAQGGGYVTVLTIPGRLFNRLPTSSELRGLSVYDLTASASWKSLSQEPWAVR